MKDKESRKSAELNLDHGDIDPSFGAGFGGFIIMHESPNAIPPDLLGVDAVTLPHTQFVMG
jgi:hypothetical protein